MDGFGGWVQVSIGKTQPFQDTGREAIVDQGRSVFITGA